MGKCLWNSDLYSDILQKALLHKVILNEVWPSTSLIIMGILPTIRKLMTPMTDHLFAHDIQPIH